METPISNFGDSGVDVTRLDRNLTYLYGLSDFFTFMFEDEEATNLILESNAITSSEVYSRFLQMSSSLSLESIQTFTSSSIKLVLLKSTDKDPLNPLKFTVNIPIENIGYVSNRPFLPTESLESNVDFRVVRKDIGSSYIQFARPIEEYKFSVRLNSDGVTEYAIWLTDVLVDEQLVYKHFGNLIGISPEKSSEAFSNFVYGLYYVYTNGPTLGLLRRGLNLVLGAPLSRGNEQVLDIRNYLSTDQYLVITDQNQYLLPFGLIPTVGIGDTIKVGDLLAEWIELKDYVHDGDWWINASIPASIIKQIPPGQKGRFATEGSPYDYLMRNYLYKNSFLVRVRVDSFKNIQNFVQITDIINKAKPAHTQPVYVWLVPSDLSDSITLSELTSLINIVVHDEDYVNPPIDFFRRDNDVNPILRGSSFFLRSSASTEVIKLMGEDNGLGHTDMSTFDEVGNPITITGARAFRSAIGPLSQRDAAWVRACSSRGSYDWNGTRGQTGFLRSLVISTVEGVPVQNGYKEFIPAGMRVVSLHTTRAADLASRLTSAGLSGSTLVLNNSFLVSGAPGFLAANYIALFTKGGGTNSASLGSNFPKYSYVEYLPGASEVKPGDSLFCSQIYPGVFGVYWVTSNRTLIQPSLVEVKSVDPIHAEYDKTLNRQGMITGTEYYQSRGGALINFGDTSGSYSDAANPVPVTITRNGVTIRHTLEA